MLRIETTYDSQPMIRHAAAVEGAYFVLHQCAGKSAHY